MPILILICLFVVVRCAGLLPRRMVSFFECGGKGVGASTDPLIARPTALTLVGNLPVVLLFSTRTVIFIFICTDQLYLVLLLILHFSLLYGLALSQHFPCCCMHPLCKFALAPLRLVIAFIASTGAPEFNLRLANL